MEHILKQSLLDTSLFPYNTFGRGMDQGLKALATHSRNGLPVYPLSSQKPCSPNCHQHYCNVLTRSKDSDQTEVGLLLTFHTGHSELNNSSSVISKNQSASVTVSVLSTPVLGFDLLSYTVSFIFTPFPFCSNLTGFLQMEESVFITKVWKFQISHQLSAIFS